MDKAEAKILAEEVMAALASEYPDCGFVLLVSFPKRVVGDKTICGNVIGSNLGAELTIDTICQVAEGLLKRREQAEQSGMN